MIHKGVSILLIIWNSCVQFVSLYLQALVLKQMKVPLNYKAIVLNLKAKPKQFIAFIWSDAKKVIVKDMESLYHVYGSKL